MAKPEADVHACTLLLRGERHALTCVYLFVDCFTGASKDVLNEVERNLMDAMFVARNVMRESRLVTGGGAIEMSISQGGNVCVCVSVVFLATREVDFG